jgi:translation initiation factor 4A
MDSQISNSSTGQETQAYLVKDYESFDDMPIPENLLRGIYTYGFEKPSAIQKKAIVPIIEGHDILAQAQSGTGKTGTFCVGSIARIDPTIKDTQVLVLVPTRELSQQIQKVANTIGQYLPIKAYSATGGTPLRDDINAIEKGAQFVVGTPGRIFDLLRRPLPRRPAATSAKKGAIGPCRKRKRLSPEAACE